MKYVIRLRTKLKRFFYSSNILFFLLFIILSHTGLSAQPAYLMSISNGEKINQTTYEFDVLLNSASEDFELTSYQAALSFDTSVINGPILFSYIENTSELSNIPSIGIGVNNADGTTELTFASMPGSDNISTQVIRVGRFRIESSNYFDIDPIVDWNFSGNISTILTGSFFINITDSSNHYSSLALSADDITEISDFELYQNYPNPFNPSTIIKFNLPKEGKVKLAVFNILGEQVVELIDAEMQEGIHEINFNGANLASGVYVYRLDIANQFSDIKKMMLVK